MGIIRRPGSSVYWLDIWIRGRRVRRSLHTTEYALALERARDVAVELRRPVPAGTNIPEFFDKYREWARETKPASYKTEDYRLTWLKDWFDAQGIASLEEVTPWHVEQMRAAIRARDRRVDPGGPLKDKESSRGTINRYCAMLRTVYNKAREWGIYTGGNPVSKVKFYRESPEVRPLSDDDVAALMVAARTIAADPWSDVQRLLPDLLTLAFNTGLRRSELIAVRWRDIRGEELAVRGKGNKRRTVPLNAAALDVIMRQSKTGEFVFDIRNRHQPDLFRRTVLRLRKLSGVADFHLHMTRHRFATDLIRAGVDIVTTSALLGHSAVMTTLLYAHPSAESKKRAVLTLGPLPCDLRGERNNPAPDTSCPTKVPQKAKSRAKKAILDTDGRHIPADS